MDMQTGAAARPDLPRLDAFAASLVAAGIAIALTAALLATATARFVRDGDGIGGDFLANYTGGTLVRQDADRLYDLRAQAATQIEASPAGEDEDLLPFVLPPAAALAFVPLSVLPYRAALALFGAINVVLLAGMALLFRRELGHVPQRPRGTFLVSALCSIPAVITLSWGQVDFLVVIGILLGWQLLRGGREFAAGGALALALVKPHFLLGVVLLLLWQRRWRPLAALGAIAAATVLGPMAILGPGVTVDYVQLIAGVREMPPTMDVRPEVMANWRGLIASIAGEDRVALWAPVGLAASVVAGAIAVRAWREDARSPRAYALAAVLPLLVSPHVHMESLVLLYAGLAIAWGGTATFAPAQSRAGVMRGEVLLALLVPVLFAGWFLTANGVALMVFASASVFAWCAAAPTPAREAARGPAPRALAA